MVPKWKILNNEFCPNCGEELEVLSECPAEEDQDYQQWLCDGEKVRCTAKCGFESKVFIYDDGEVIVQ